MIPKRTQLGWFEQGPSCTLLNTYSKGVDKDQLQKIASSTTIIDIKPVKGHSFVHLITMGAGEYYGANVNADFFNEKEGTVTFPHPCPGVSPTMELDGGLMKYHHTYMEHGGVYHNHNNSKKGFAKEGSIAFEMYNTKMHRGEVIVDLEDSKWTQTLQKLANGEPVLWSMGCSVPFDICSDCGTKARNLNQRCPCLRFDKLGIDKEGHQKVAINDRPCLHDISDVLVPADKIAFGLRKVASGLNYNQVFINSEENKGLYIPVSVMNKIASRKEADRYSLIVKLASIEKKLLAKTVPESETLSEAMEIPEEQEKDIAKKLETSPLSDITSAGRKHRVMLTPKTFVRIVIKKDDSEPDLSGMDQSLKTVFADMLGDDNLPEILEDGSYEPGASCSKSVEDKVKGLSADLSIDPEAVQKRVIKVALKPKKNLEKKARADEPPTEAAKLLAREYAKYQLSFLAGTCSESDLLLTAIRNHAV